MVKTCKCGPSTKYTPPRTSTNTSGTPTEAPVDECWIVEIEGQPSVRVVVQSLASVVNNTTRYADDPKSIPPGYWITAGPLVRAIPIAMAARRESRNRVANDGADGCGTSGIAVQ
jgi:hypothetical protein